MLWRYVFDKHVLKLYAGFQLHSFSNNFSSVRHKSENNIYNFMLISLDSGGSMGKLYFLQPGIGKHIEISCIFSISDTDGRSNPFTEKLKNQDKEYPKKTAKFSIIDCNEHRHHNDIFSIKIIINIIFI